MVNTKQHMFSAHVKMLISTTLVATSFPIGAAITHTMDSLVLTFLRFTLAAIIFGIYVQATIGHTRPKVVDIVRYAAISLPLVGFFWGMFEALRLTTPLNTATIFTLSPLLTLIFVYVLLKQRQPTAVLAILPLGLLGSLWIVFGGDLQQFLALEVGQGDLIFLAATVSMGFYTVMVKAYHRGEPMARMTFWTLVTGAGWLFLLSAPQLPSQDWTAVPIQTYFAIGYLAIFTTLITFFFQQNGIIVLGPSRGIAYTFLNPVAVVIISFIFLEQVPSPSILPGILLSFMTTLIILWSLREKDFHQHCGATTS